jgi:hypothetical protein
MSANRLNNYEDPQSLPEGFRFRQDAVWQQLETRLHPPVRKKRPFVYAAAACLLLAAGTFYLQPKEQVATTNRAIVAAPVSAPASKKVQLHTTTVAPSAPGRTATATPLVSAKTSAIPPAHTPAIPSKEPELLAQQKVPAPDTAAVVKTTEATAAVPAPAQRRFRIAHANELSSPPALPQLQAKDPARIYARLRPALDIPETSSFSTDPEPPQRGLFGIVRNKP